MVEEFIENVYVFCFNFFLLMMIDGCLIKDRINFFIINLFGGGIDFVSFYILNIYVYSMFIFVCI